ncbi:hypothetical protein [Streptomyces sp. NPDC056723]|uniref:hypothetical protein n=1 Tax=Streptomyces sp. NPDC056723 TaxID=3345925 RepID=UPI0036C2EAEE
MTEQTTPDPIAYGPTGVPCGCGKDAHSNLVPCQPDAAPSAPADGRSIQDVMGPADGQQKMRLLADLYANTTLVPAPTDQAAEAQQAEPALHLGNKANAEDCPACAVERRNLPYPFLCPAGPAEEAGRG